MTEENANTKSILVVEDDNDIRNLYVEILNGEGFHVNAAASGEEALEILCRKEREPCLVLTDFMMPGMNGDQLVKILRREDLIVSVPIVMISAKPLSSEETQGVDFLKKPIDVDTIIDKVREYCGPPHSPCTQKGKKDRALEDGIHH